MQTDPIGYSADMNLYVYCNNNPITCSDPTGEVPLPLVTGALGFGAGAVGSAIGQVISNQGFNNFSWPNVGIAAGVGFVAGLAAPYTAVNALGAALTGSVSNIAQYGITQTYNGQDITTQGVVLNGVPGIAGGLVSGPIAQASGLTYTTTSLASSLNNDLSVAANATISTGVRNILGSVVSNTDPTTAFSSNSGAAANGGFVLYSNMPNTNQMKSVYSK